MNFLSPPRLTDCEDRVRALAWIGGLVMVGVIANAIGAATALDIISWGR